MYNNVSVVNSVHFFKVVVTKTPFSFLRRRSWEVEEDICAH
jgi:hypothetical protein